MAGYGQFCPIAKTMEVLDERWTILVIRELLCGSHHFNELRRGVPRMSPALLTKRLRSLERVGLVIRSDRGNRVRYDLTPAGRDLAPIVTSLGEWGVRWMTELGDEDLDPHLLMWDIHRNIDLAAVPSGRTVLQFHLTDVSRSTADWWIVIDHDDVDLCDFDPGFEVHVRVESDLPTLVRVWRGDLTWRAALAEQTVHLDGSRQAVRAFPHWLKLSMFAHVPRRAGQTVGVG